MKVHGLALVLALVVGTIGCGSSSSHFLYVVGPGTNSVIAFQQLSTGALNVLPDAFTTDAQPVSVVIHASGKFAYTANFAAANLTVFDRDTGKGTMAIAKDPTTGTVIGPITVAANPAVLAMTPGGQFLYVLSQKTATTQAVVSAFGVDGTTGNLTAIGSPIATPTPGPASPLPVSITVAANSKFVYVADSAQGIVAGFVIGSTGALSAMQGSPFTVGTAPSFVLVDPQAKFLYVADQTGNSIFAFSIDPNTGVPTAISGSPFAAGANPVSLAVDSTGAILVAANRGSNNVSAYSVNSGSGSLTPVSGSPFATGKAPAFATVDFTGKFVYVGDSGTNDIEAFAISSGGTLKAVTGSPFNIVTSPVWLISR